MTEADALHARMASLEQEQTHLRADLAVHRAALVWLMGVHQLGPEDRNPQLAVVEPLGLDTSLQRVRQVDGKLDAASAEAARAFLADAHAVFVARQQPKLT